MTEEQGQGNPAAPEQRGNPQDSFEYEPKENLVVEQAPMNRSQKTMLWGVGVVGLLVMSLAVFQMRSILAVPWPNLASANPEVTALTTADASTDLEAMKNKDTDGDGLSDYDELQRYGTSPYLADTDSDSTSDKDEILLGKDPNCPEGKTCFVASTPDAASVAAGDATAGTSETVGTSAATGTTPAVEPTPEQLRELLRQSGSFTEEQIVAFTDTELMALYEKVLAENPDLQSSATTQVPASATAPQSYTPAQIRELLKQQGITDEELLQIDDATLVELYQKALSEVTTPSTP